ncbi:HTH domain-containing protein [Sulfurospirillum sp. hDNRA2]|uniref:HTH domain-containing protein n=1 Tax=Sulfurospirillum sp. hDNRA2 TaxID=3237298 RepID=UPI0020B74BDB|nr:HTH domain-containing protein [Sulfurospirillum sp. DNRA8]MCP3651994.1 HTH domain-containing protein [Sulfurospirillum sp. DNRA8]MCR1810841.1 HTH domain-containing protein [Sulfurospirillum sp. DNRA8]
MTIKDSILKALENFKKPVSYQEVTKYILDNKLYAFEGQTPHATVSALLGDFIRKNDTRVARVKQNGAYFYYLTKNDLLAVEEANVLLQDENGSKKGTKACFSERDLHVLFVSYLKSLGIYAKTILHEESKNSKDDTQKWAHPDIIGVKFAKFKSATSSKLLKTLERKDSCEIISYEIKKEINSDYELKKYYFQAVSNSTWANLGYLVAFEINDNLKEEMERLNKSFGIGVIKLHANPFESQILFQSSYKNLDYQTIDKLCHINEKYRQFIEQIEKILSADDKYVNSSLLELEKECDMYYEKDEDILNYCTSKNIPIE